MYFHHIQIFLPQEYKFVTIYSFLLNKISYCRLMFFKNSDLVICIWTSGYRYETIAKNIISLHNILQVKHGEMLLQ